MYWNFDWKCYIYVLERVSFTICCIMDLHQHYYFTNIFVWFKIYNYTFNPVNIYRNHWCTKIPRGAFYLYLYTNCAALLYIMNVYVIYKVKYVVYLCDCYRYLYLLESSASGTLFCFALLFVFVFFLPPSTLFWRRCAFCAWSLTWIFV